MNRVIPLCVLALALLSGCEDASKPSAEDNNTQNQDQKDETFIDPQLKAMEKAKGVEQTIKDAEALRKKQMEEQASNPDKGN